jgi:hypothetical protein
MKNSSLTYSSSSKTYEDAPTTLVEPLPTFVPWLKIPKSIKIISKYYKYPMLRLNGGFTEFKSNNFFFWLKFVHKGEGNHHACSFTLRLHPPTDPPLCKKKLISKEKSGFSGFLEGFNEWIGENIFLGHNFLLPCGRLLDANFERFGACEAPAGLVPPTPRPCGNGRSGMVKNVRPIPVEAHYEHMQPARGWGGGERSRIKLHPHVGVVRPYHHLRMCDELVSTQIFHHTKI